MKTVSVDDENGSAVQGATLQGRLKHVTDQLSQVQKAIESDPTSVGAFASDRDALVGAAQALVAASKGPVDAIMDTMVMTAQMTAMRLFISWKVFEAIPSQGSISFEELGAKVNGDPALLARIGGILVSNKILTRDDSGNISHTAMSAMLSSANPLTALVQMGFDDYLSTLTSMPAYFKQYGLKEPDSQLDTIYAFACGDPKLTVFEHMARSPERATNFMLSMSAVGQGLTAAGSYDFSWAVDMATKSEDRVLLVDIGAGHGDAVKSICEANPGLPIERCVIEDVPQVIEEASKTDDAVLSKAQYAGMDYHKEQPIKGALLYFIRRVLHDYGDTDATNILMHIRSAMASDSRLLIVEQVMSVCPSPLETATDLFLGSIGGKERTVQGFEKIVSAAGLEIERIEHGNPSDVAVIVCAPKSAA